MGERRRDRPFTFAPSAVGLPCPPSQVRSQWHELMARSGSALCIHYFSMFVPSFSSTARKNSDTKTGSGLHELDFKLTIFVKVLRSRGNRRKDCVRTASSTACFSWHADSMGGVRVYRTILQVTTCDM